MTTIEIFELRNTHGCAAVRESGKADYGFNSLPSSAKLWCQVTGGDAVELILDAGLGAVTKTEPGAYGGQCRTVSVDVDELERHCRATWDRLNARSEDAETCHYCGQRAGSTTGFFHEPVCRECS